MTQNAVLSLDFIKGQAEEEQIIPTNFKQVKLTKKFLLPRVKDLHDDMLRLRRQYDQEFYLTDHPKKDAYPKGCCYEITKGVKTLLERELQSPKTVGLVALRDFCLHGGIAKRVWGNLRHQYFQNAFQFGDLYVDVSNDTVTITKPKVEILPLGKARFFPITDYDIYANLAEKYWNGKVYPNRILPELAVMFPVFFVSAEGELQLHANYQTILYRNMQFDFALAEKFLIKGAFQDRILPDRYVDQLTKKFGVLEAALSNNDIKRYFEIARQSELRLDAVRCQLLLDQAQAI
ncbi:hypothetical protein [Thalassospira alkalitolerans]|uniref:hypothetical protein n=1 Tax=Thalassospira alkalitolerans TaxID=1293890 RepID=UPI000A1D9FED|nr:hypothetical protein [Thalassospira alkalitolerans]